MGYTIYWYREKSVESATFEKILQDFRKIQPQLKRSGLLLAGPGGEGAPIINSDEVIFNGLGKSQGCCEAFCFMRELLFTHSEPTKRDGKYFESVKTEGLPYGFAAAVFLIIAKHYLEDRIKISSDNPVSTWDKPREWCQRIFRYGAEFLLENNSVN